MTTDARFRDTLKSAMCLRPLGGHARSFSTFSPVAVAAIGTLPLPVMHRCPGPGPNSSGR
jgi:hypothetical protein